MTTAHALILIDALRADSSSDRLRAALQAGTTPDAALIDPLVARCAVEPDFFVRDMLTWALCRQPAEATVPRLLDELQASSPQARSQALHTLSKIGDGKAWPAVSAHLHDADDDVARAAWRAAVALAPDRDKAGLAMDLATELGRGGREVAVSLSRAFVALGDAAQPALDVATNSADARVRAHARATQQLVADPDSGFAPSIDLAKRVAATGTGTSEKSV